MFGDDLRKARKKGKRSQAQLAEALGVSVSTIKRWEAKAHRPASKLVREFLLKTVKGLPNLGESGRAGKAGRPKKKGR